MPNNLLLEKYTVSNVVNDKKTCSQLVQCYQTCADQIKDMYVQGDSFIESLGNFDATLQALEHPENNIFYVMKNVEWELLWALWILDQGVNEMQFLDNKQYRVLYSKFLGISEGSQNQGIWTIIKQKVIDLFQEEVKEYPYFFYSRVKETNTNSQKMNKKLAMEEWKEEDTWYIQY